jgi:hypothetical protein
MLDRTTNSSVINTESFSFDHHALQCTLNVQQLTDKSTFRKQRKHIRNYNLRKTLRTKDLDKECWTEFAKICNDRKTRVKHWDQTPDGQWKQLHHIIFTATNKSLPKRSHTQKCRPVTKNIYNDLNITLCSTKRKQNKLGT